MNAPSEETVTCPACGGAGGGPFGPAGSAWDDESYVCPRCKGTGVIAWDDVAVRPGLAKAQGQPAIDEAKKKTG
jgi:hypothetical protein